MTQIHDSGPVLEAEPARPQIEGQASPARAAVRFGQLRSAPAVLQTFASLSQSVARWTGIAPQPQLDTPFARPVSRRYVQSFIVCVILPTLAVGLYLAFIASNQYVAEARFAVTSSKYDLTEKPKSSSSSSSTGLTAVANQDAYIVSTYIRSRAIIDDIAKTINVREAFRRPEADFWARLPAEASKEELTEYWRDMVTAYVDSTSGIVTVKVRAFRREDALAIAQAIVVASETLANTVSARARQYTIKLAEDEVDKNEKRVLGSLKSLRTFRDSVGFIDPTAQARDASLLIVELMQQRIHLQGEYDASSLAMSPEAPTLVAVKNKLDTLDKQIAEMRAQLTSDNKEAATVASVLPKYEELDLSNKVAEKMFSLAEEGLERARLRAESQNIFVNAFVPPDLPEDAEYPKRIWTVLAFAGVLVILWGIGALVFAVIDDHRI